MMLDDLYPMNQEIIKEVNEELKNYNIDKGQFTEGVLNFEMLIHLELLREFNQNVLNRIITPVYYYKALVREEPTNYKSLALHAENGVIRLISFWEHLFQILNTYLGIFMTPKREIIEINNTWINRIIFSLKLNKEQKYLRGYQNYLDGQNFIKKVKKKYRNDSTLRTILSLSNADHWKQMRKLRNEVIHYKFLGQISYPLDIRGDDYMITFANLSENKINHGSLGSLMDNGLDDIKNALTLTHTLLKQDLVPTKKSSIRDEYFLLKINCPCSEEKNLYQITY